ncbi:Cytosolic sulfotransferase 15 [Bienertia sinuspersici]
MSNEGLLNTQLQSQNPHSSFRALRSQYMLFSTHLPYDSLPESVINSKCKIIYITHNPFNTLVSSWHYYLKLENVDNNIAYPGEITESIAFEVRGFEGRWCITDEEEKQGVVEGIIELCSIDSLKEMEVNKKGKCDPDFEHKCFFRSGWWVMRLIILHLLWLNA